MSLVSNTPVIHGHNRLVRDEQCFAWRAEKGMLQQQQQQWAEISFGFIKKLSDLFISLYAVFTCSRHNRVAYLNAIVAICSFL